MANTAFEHSPTLQVPSSTTTNGLVTWDANDGGGFLSSASTLTLNNGVLGTLLQLTVDNLRFDGRAISSLDTDGNITITPNGTGTVEISKTSTPTLLLTNGTNAYAITLNTGTTAANYTITLPAALPGASGKILQSSGGSPHSVLVWADAGAANQNAWTTITRSATGTGTAAGDASVAATTTTDSLDLVAGDNITITGDSSNQKYTIAAAGGGVTDYSAKRTMSSSQPITSGASGETITWQTQVFDTGSYTSESNTAFKASSTTAGKHIVFASIRWDGNTTGDRTLYIAHNNDGVLAKLQMPTTDNVNNECEMTISALADLANGEYVWVVAAQQSGDDLNASSSNSQFSIIRIA